MTDDKVEKNESQKVDPHMHINPDKEKRKYFIPKSIDRNARERTLINGCT